MEGTCPLHLLEPFCFQLQIACDRGRTDRANESISMQATNSASPRGLFVNNLIAATTWPTTASPGGRICCRSAHSSIEFTQPICSIFACLSTFLACNASADMSLRPFLPPSSLPLLRDIRSTRPTPTSTTRYFSPRRLVAPCNFLPAVKVKEFVFRRL